MMTKQMMMMMVRTTSAATVTIAKTELIEQRLLTNSQQKDRQTMAAYKRAQFDILKQ